MTQTDWKDIENQYLREMLQMEQGLVIELQGIIDRLMIEMGRMAEELE